MSKRAFPLLYIHQPKEVETEAENQDFFYRKKIVVTQKNDSLPPADELVKQELEETHELNEEVQLEEEREGGSEEFTIYEQEMIEKFSYIESLPVGIEPKIEIKLSNNERHVGTLEEIEEGTVVLRTRTAPYRVECLLKEVSSVKIISL